METSLRERDNANSEGLGFEREGSMQRESNRPGVVGASGVPDLGIPGQSANVGRRSELMRE